MIFGSKTSFKTNLAYVEAITTRTEFALLLSLWSGLAFASMRLGEDTGGVSERNVFFSSFEDLRTHVYGCSFLPGVVETHL